MWYDFTAAGMRNNGLDMHTDSPMFGLYYISNHTAAV